MTLSTQSILRKTLIVPVMVSSIALSSCESEVTDPYAAGVQAFEKHDYQAARLYFRQALDATPANPERQDIGFQYAQVLLAMENPEGAMELLRPLLDEPEAFPAAPGLMAKAYLLSGNGQGALELLESTGMPDALSYAMAVGAYLSVNDGDAATARLDKGLSLFPDSADLIVLDANRAFDTRDLAEARLRLGMALSENPSHVEARLLGGRLELYDRQFSAAREHFEAVLEVQPWNMSAMVSLAAMERDSGNDDAAKSWLEKARAISPDHPVATYFAAQMAFDVGDVSKADSLLQSIPSDLSDIPVIWLLRGQISASKGQSNTAISEIERYFQRGGEGNMPRLQLAKLYQKSGDLERAWHMLSPVLRSYNASEAALALGKELAQKLGKPDVQNLAERSRTLNDQKRYETQMQAADGAIKSGEWEEAGRLYSEILAMAELSNPVVLNNAANVQLKLGNFAEAYDLASRAYSLAPQDPIIMDTMGWSMMQAQGKSSRATSLIKQAFDLAPSNREIADHVIIAGQ